jgi:predicted peroxiredoxin
MSTENKNFFYTLTTSNDPDRIAVPFVLANAALAMGQDVILWLTLDGVKVAEKGAMDNMTSPSFSEIKNLMTQYAEAGGKIGVCPACANTHGIIQDNVVDNASWMGAAAVQEASQGRQIMTF